MSFAEFLALSFAEFLALSFAEGFAESGDGFARAAGGEQRYAEVVADIDQGRLKEEGGVVAGDDVFGFVTVNEGIKVHKTNCPNALQLQSNYSYRIMPAKWIDSTQTEFKSNLEISGIDTIGLVNEVTKVISNNLHIDMKSVHFDSNDGVFTGKIVVVVKNKTILNNLVENIKKINGIDKVTRV